MVSDEVLSLVVGVSLSVRVESFAGGGVLLHAVITAWSKTYCRYRLITRPRELLAVDNPKVMGCKVPSAVRALLIKSLRVSTASSSHWSRC